MDVFVQTIGFGIVGASIIAIAAAGFTIQFSLTNVLNLNYGSTMTIAGFVAYEAWLKGVNIWLDVIIGGLAAAALTILLARTVFRVFARPGIGLFQMVMVSLALSIVLEYVTEAVSGDQIFSFAPQTGSSFSMGPMVVTGGQVGIVLVSVLALIVVWASLRLTRLGKALRAMAADPGLARSCGIPTHRIVTIAWLVSGFFCGAGGVVYVINSQSLSFGTGYEFLPSVLAAAILGGVGSVEGAALASLGLGIVTAAVSAVGGSAYSTVVAFGVLIVVLLVAPGSVSRASARGTEVTV